MMGNLLFPFGEPKGRIIRLPDHRTGHPSQLWFKHNGDWVRQEWCGKFPDGSPRPPWHDDRFMMLWETHGPEYARDKRNYDLADLDALNHPA